MKNKTTSMKKKSAIMLFAFIIGNLGCSSSEKNSSGSQGKSSVTNESAGKETILNMDTEDAFSDTSAASTPEPSFPEIGKETSALANKVESNSVYWPLNKAIKSQKDAQIKKEATQILLKNPKDLVALNALAMSSYRNGKYTLARYLLNKAKQYHPNSPEVYSNLGVIDLASNEKRSAILNFKKALEINSNDPVAAANIGSLYVSEKDYSKASIALEIPYRKGWKDPKVLNNYAIALSAMGKYEKANSIYDEILKVQPMNKEVLFNSAVLLIEHLKKYNEGLDRLQKLKFAGGPADSKNRIIALENKAKTGLK